MPEKKLVARVIGHGVTTVVAEHIDAAIVASSRLSEGDKAVARVANLVARLVAHGVVEAAVATMED
jgi:hypothetical protein